MPLQFQHQHQQQQSNGNGGYYNNSRNPAALHSMTNSVPDESKTHKDQSNLSAQDYNYPAIKLSNKSSSSGYKQKNPNQLQPNKVAEFKLGNLANYQVKGEGPQYRIDGAGDKVIPMKQGKVLPNIINGAVIADQQRKMSLAAKAGQMQIFSNFNQNNEIQLNYNYENRVYSQNQSSQKIDEVIRTTKERMKNVGLPPQSHPQNSHYGSQLSQQSTTANQQQLRQFDSYMGRRQIIQQQREKKQELLKQLDHGRGLSNNISQQMNANRNERNFKMQTQPLINFSGLRREEDNITITSRELNGSSFQQKRRSTNHGQSVSVHVNKDINFLTHPEDQQAYMLVHHHEHDFTPASPEKQNSHYSAQRGPIPGGNASLETDSATQRRRMAGIAIAAVANQQNGALNNQLNILTNLAQIKGRQVAEIQQQGTSPSSQTNEKPPLTSPITMKDMPVVSGVSLGYALNPMQSSVTNNNSIEKLQKAKEQQKVETSNHSKELHKVVQENKIETQPVQIQQQPSSNNSVNSRITRKLEGGRPHKVYDYMFIQMSNEQFRTEYCGKKIIILGENGQQVDPAPQYHQRYDEHYQYQNFSPRKIMKDGNKMMSPYKVLDKNGKLLGAQSPPNGNNSQFSPNLNGLVQIKAYDNVITDELPIVQCNLLPTQLDHVKVLICEQEDKNYPKLTIDAANRFEIEKQNQIKQYMEDIISKLQQKDRKFKVTVKKKFVEDALYNSTSIRVASVYVIVINREKAYDPLLNQKQYRPPRRQITQDQQESSEEEEDNANQEPQRMRKDSTKKGNPIWLNNNLKKSHYDSDHNGNGYPGADNLNSTGTSSNLPQFKKLLQDNKQKRQGPMTSAPNFKRAKRDEDVFVGYKYQPPVKEYKHGQTKIKIVQEVTAHDHHLKHHLNVYFNQYNEFIRIIFKAKPVSNSQNAQPPPKMNIPYLVGLSRALGLNLKKDAFSEANLKSREHLAQLKEKLIFCFYNKLNESNKDLEPQTKSGGGESTGVSSSLNDTEQDNIDESVDSEGKNSINQRLSFSKEPNSAQDLTQPQQKDFSVSQLNSQQLPPSNVIYKYFIGKGNNSIMVRSLFKNRYWWMQHDREEMEKVNFCWTQNKKQAIMDVLSCKFPNKKSGIKNNSLHAQKQILATPQNKKQKKKIQSQERTIQKETPQPTASTRTNETKLYNKIEDNFHMNNKKALFLNMKNYYDALDQDVFDNLPLTFHVKEGLDDPEFHRFKQYYDKFEEEIKANKKKRKENKEEEEESPKKENQYYRSLAPQKNIWIVKPGENTNRGMGIQVAREFNEIRDIIVDSTANKKRTCIVQKYIHNPLLIHRRKFDIRTYALMTTINGNLKCYLYEEGYLRTSSREYSIQNLSNKLVHLTNDAVQKRSDEYGKFEPGNKLSYNEFQAFLDKTYPDLNICFERDILPQMNKMTVDIFRACHGKLDPKRRLNCMEVFGLDFMICDEFKPYLIEVNTNPCLELSSPLLARLIPNMLENALKIGLDTQFLPPEHFSSKKAFIGDACPENRFSLCYDDKIDGPVLDKLFEKKNNIIIEMDEDELSEDEHDDEEE